MSVPEVGDESAQRRRRRPARFVLAIALLAALPTAALILAAVEHVRDAADRTH